MVHARGAGGYGFFEPYDDWPAEYTAARFLTTPGTQTPVFVRFSTVAGSRGSADTVRDVRGFATKFYTERGNYDLVGNNFPGRRRRVPPLHPAGRRAHAETADQVLPESLQSGADVLEEHVGDRSQPYRRRVRV
ncbi:hypothetical protein B586_20100 [Mycobacterium haemophilum DSM 44634]|nr:hypothetical protein B586_20100 [Mycobacterium haemophilum DSM 44634]